MGIRRLLGIGDAKPRYNEELGYSIRELPPSNGSAVDLEYAAIPVRDIPALAVKYFAAMEIGQTHKWCKCPWWVHPEDQEVKPGNCRKCNQPSKHPVHDGLPEDFEDVTTNRHKFAGRRMRRMDDAPDCPVHTKEGMLTYFFTWVFDQHD